MTHSLNRTNQLVALGLATAATAFSGAAVAQAGGSDAVQNADLVALSGGGLVHYEVDGKATAQTVTIAGRKAQKIIAATEDGTEGAYHALMNGKPLKVGGTYSVTISLKVDGKSVVFKDRLVVHRRHARRS